MKTLAKVALGALAVGGVAFATVAPAAAHTSVGISFGFGYPGYGYANSCDYYDYYDAPPPWGLPPGYCGYPVYYGPVYWDGYWYRGPIYYRWDGDRRLYWLHGGWRYDGWHGRRPGHIEWHDRDYGHWRGGAYWHGGGGVHWRSRGGHWHGDRDDWHGGGAHWRGRSGGAHWHGGGGHWHGGGHHGHH